MKQSKQSKAKESIGEKLRRHTMDIMILSMVAALALCFAKAKRPIKKSLESDTMHEIKSVTDVTQVNSIHFSDSIKSKTR
jgi:uncharacterized protein YpmB